MFRTKSAPRRWELSYRRLRQSGANVVQDEQLLIRQARRGDGIAFGRPFLANPDLVERLRRDAPLNAPNFRTFYTQGPEGYLDYPALDQVPA